MLSPSVVPLWFAGLVWLCVNRRSRPWRFLGWTYVIFLALMMATRDAKDYYLAPVYPAIFAAGGVCWQALLAKRGTRWIVPAYATLSVITGILIRTHDHAHPPGRSNGSNTPRACTCATKQSNTENDRHQRLPAVLCRSLWLAGDGGSGHPHLQRAACPPIAPAPGIFCSNYGEASAINFLGAGRGLPFAISGHNNYWIWGPHGETGDVIIVINGASLDEMRKYYDSVEIAGVMDHPYAMPYEHRNIYLCRGRKGSISKDWPEFKHYI